jgi:ParB family transcriptional regulator, chromosome partitioning protein
MIDSSTASSSQNSLSSLPIDEIQPNPFQPRSKIASEDIQDLKQSIESYGILEPLVVAQTPAGYQIIAGERRWRAARELGLTNVPVVIRKTTPRGMLEMAIVENVQRVDLSAIERAQAFQQLLRDFGYNQQQISAKVGKSASYVNNSLRLLKLPDAVKDGLVGGQITEGHARAILGVDDEKLQVEIYKMLLKENGSVRRAEELARKFRDLNDIAPKRPGKTNRVKDDRLDIWQEQLTQTFVPYVRKAKVKLARSDRQTKITITLPGDPDSTQPALEKILGLTEK